MIGSGGYDRFRGIFLGLGDYNSLRRYESVSDQQENGAAGFGLSCQR